MVLLRARRTKACRPGLAAVEMAVLLPFLCFLFVVALDFSRVFYFSLTVTNCARNGGVYGCADPTAALNQTGISTAAKKDAGNLNSASLTVSSSTDSTTNPTTLTVSVSYPFTTITTYPGIPTSMTITRTVVMSVSPLIPN